MKIYTRIGDKGQTRLGDGSTVRKDDGRIACYGILDELNAVLGLCATAVQSEDINRELLAIQSRLFALGSYLASPKMLEQCKAGGYDDDVRLRFADNDVARLEELIDRFSEELAPLKTFILPGGVAGAAWLHMARTVCRRLERKMVAIAPSGGLPDLFITYVNRLGDLLFTWARYENRGQGHPDQAW